MGYGNSETVLGSQNFLVRPKSMDNDLITMLANAHQKVITLDVMMYEVMGMYLIQEI